MRILITGASGFVGKHLSEHLSEHRPEQDKITLMGTSLAPLPPPSSRVLLVEHDLRRPLSEIGTFDVIINLASRSHVDESIKEPRYFALDNIEMMLNILEYARSHPPKLFLQFSTEEIFSDAISPYAASKACQDILAASYWQTYGVPVVVTHSSSIIGEGQSSQNFVPKVARSVAAGSLVPIYTTGAVPGTRYWTPIANICSAVDFILDLPVHTPLQTSTVDQYFLDGGEELNNLDMALLIAKKLGKPLIHHLVDGKSLRPGYASSPRERGNCLTSLGWTPPQDIAQGLSWLSPSSTSP